MLAAAAHSTTHQPTIDALWLIYAAAASGAGIGAWKWLTRALKRSLTDVITQTVTPQIAEVHKRIDTHMDTEEKSLEGHQTSLAHLQQDLTGIKETLDERTGLFGDVKNTLNETQTIIAKHMADDTAQFDASKTALVEGQKMLLERLATVERIRDDQQIVLGRLEKLERWIAKRRKS